MKFDAMSIFVLLILIINVILGLFVYLRSPRNKINILFSLMVLSIFGWLGANFLVDVTSDINFALFLTRVTNFFATWSVSFFALFTIATAAQNNQRVKKNRALIYVSASLVSALSLTNLVISGVYLENGVFAIEDGPLLYLQILYYLILVLTSVGLLIMKFVRSGGVEKEQSRYMLIGFSATLIGAVFFSILIPVIFQIYSTFKITPFTTLFFVGFTTYAIIKHRLMDIRMVVARSVAYSLLLLILAGFYAGSVLGIQALFFPQASADFSFAEGAMRTIIAVIMVFLFQPLKKWITKVTDSIFFKEQYNVEELLDKVAHTVSATIIMIEMIYKTLDLLVTQMKISRGMIIVFSDNNTVLDSQSVGYKETPKLVTKEILSLAHDGVLVADELSENSKYKQLLIKYNASVAVPLKAESKPAGLLLFGEKQSGDMFSANDLKVFEIIGPEIAVAITNAKSYERIERFNITLRQEIKKAIAELEKKNEQLRELDKAKDEFISMASHQLRTPLTAIKGYLSMLLEGDAGEIKVSQYDFVNEAFQGANRMVGLINDLLNVSRMETGRFFLEPKEVDMEKVVREEVSQLNKQAKEKGLGLEIKIKGKIPVVWVDDVKIRQVVMNFADNAIYYTTAGSVLVTLEKDDKHIVYKVKDTGIGVPKAQQKQLFEKFFRADNARHVRPDGTGLGIYLAKKVIDDHGGKLLFESTEGKGSTFGFRLPIKSKLKIKRISAPTPDPHVTRPEIGELAAGIGINPATLEATQEENGSKS
jgi:signal transduction histidine kinase